MDSKKLQDFADTLRMVNANKSGNAQGVAFYSNQIKQRQLEEQAKLKKLADQKKRDDFYNSLNANQKMIFDMIGLIVRRNLYYYYRDHAHPLHHFLDIPISILCCRNIYL